MMMTKEPVSSLPSREATPECLRRFFHRIPETNFDEKETTRAILKWAVPFADSVRYGRALYADGLRDEGTPEDIEEGFTGALFAIEGKSPYLLIRADIDGLPMGESEDPAHRPTAEGWRSLHDGAMHACGHDGHIALALHLLRHFSEKRPRHGVKVLFQPAEEGVRGAKRMHPSILEDVGAVLGFHIGLGQPSGTIGVGTTGFLAAQKIELTFIGRAAHSANNPQDGACAFAMASAFGLLARELTRDARGKKLLNIGTVRGGTAKNAVMERCTLGMDIRSDETSLLEELAEGMRNTAEHIAASRGGRTEWVTTGTSESFTAGEDPHANAVAAALQREGFSTTLHPDFGASEDVTLYFNRVREKGGLCLHLLLGTDLASGHHTDRFDFPSEDLPSFARALEIASRELLHMLEI